MESETLRIPTIDLGEGQSKYMSEKLLEVRDLHVFFRTKLGVVKAVDGVTFDVEEEKTVGLVGESGCGKSVTSMALLQLVAKPGKIDSGEIVYHSADGEVDLASLDPKKSKQMRSIRGKDFGIVFQEPMTSLSAIHTIGNQIVERILTHEPKVSKAEARERVIERLNEVGLPRPAQLIDRYTFELSGGMRQRAMIAMALVCDPRMLIADEPTTALDVTVQAQILELIGRLKSEHHMSVLNITHDLGVIAKLADIVIVMYLGVIVERTTVEEIFENPLHPYTKALMRSIPSANDAKKGALAEIKGSVPSPYLRPKGCRFGPRCEFFMKGLCDREEPELYTPQSEHDVRCYLYTEEGRQYGR